MDDFKFDLIWDAHPNKEVFQVNSLDASKLSTTYEKIRAFIGGELESPLEVVRAIYDKSEPIDGVDANDDGFSFSDVLKSLCIEPNANVYINWYRFDNVDEISIKNLTEYFDDIWFPSSDDIDVFDDSFSWIVSVSHDGKVSSLE